MYHQAILGDLNTMAHGIARLSPNYCCDAMRFWSIGQTEAYFWHHKVFSVTDPRHVPERDGEILGESSPWLSGDEARTSTSAQCHGFVMPPCQQWQWWIGPYSPPPEHYRELSMQLRGR